MKKPKSGLQKFATACVVIGGASSIVAAIVSRVKKNKAVYEAKVDEFLKTMEKQGAKVKTAKGKAKAAKRLGYFKSMRKLTMFFFVVAIVSSIVSFFVTISYLLGKVDFEETFYIYIISIVSYFLTFLCRLWADGFVDTESKS